MPGQNVYSNKFDKQRRQCKTNSCQRGWRSIFAQNIYQRTFIKFCQILHAPTQTHILTHTETHWLTPGNELLKSIWISSFKLCKLRDLLGAFVCFQLFDFLANQQMTVIKCLCVRVCVWFHKICNNSADCAYDMWALKADFALMQAKSILIRAEHHWENSKWNLNWKTYCHYVNVACIWFASL